MLFVYLNIYIFLVVKRYCIPKKKSVNLLDEIEINSMKVKYRKKKCFVISHKNLILQIYEYLQSICVQYMIALIMIIYMEKVTTGKGIAGVPSGDHDRLIKVVAQ